jgi:hypothetical protein
VLAKRDLLLQLAQLWVPAASAYHKGSGGYDEPHIVPFLLAVVADRSEPDEVRSDALKWLSDGPRLIPYRRPVAEAILQVLREGASLELRLQATLALAELTGVTGVLTTLGDLALDSAETIDVRYAAFTSIEHGGPTPEGIALLRQMTADETFGHSARSLLARWHLYEERTAACRLTKN